MASIRHHYGKWQVQIRLSTGPRLTRSFHQKADAVKWARTTESDIEGGRYRDSNCPETLHDTLKRYLGEVTAHKRSAHKERLRVARLMREPFTRLKVRDITPVILNQFRDRRLQEVKAQAVRHDLNLLSHAIKIARLEWGLEIRENPVDLIRKPPQPAARTRRLQSDELGKLLAAASHHSNKFFQAFIILAIETGMRKGELLGLTWRDIDMQRGEAYLGMTKNGLARMVPFSPIAQQTIKGLAEMSGSIGRENRLLPLSVPMLRFHWDKLTKEVGTEDFHIHDLRREAVSRLFEYGLSIPEVASISGHRDLRMVARYVKFNTLELGQKLSRLTTSKTNKAY